MKLRQCADAVETYVDWSVEDVLRQRPGVPSLEHVEVVQPVLFSVHVALAELWLANGLVAQAVVGQSQGEIAAACVAGALGLEDAVPTSNPTLHPALLRQRRRRGALHFVPYLIIG
jgi:acyl transferase domain-containing protein